jgi:hypothetical protein
VVVEGIGEKEGGHPSLISSNGSSSSGPFLEIEMTYLTYVMYGDKI